MEIKPNQKEIKVIPVTNLNFILKVHWGYGSPINTNFHKLKITLLSVDGAKINNNNKFLQLSIHTVDNNDQIIEKRDAELIDITIPPNYYPAPELNNPRNIKIPINVVIDENQIIDFYKKEISVKFLIEVQEAADSEMISTERELIFDIITEDADSDCKFVFEDKFEKGFTHLNKEKVRLGNLNIFKIGNDAITNNPIIFDLKLNSENQDFINLEYNGNSSNNIKHIDSLTNLTIPVFLDLTKIPNPNEKQTYSFDISYSYTKNKEIKNVSKKWSFDILQNSSSTKLITQLIKDSQVENLLNEESTDLQTTKHWIPNKRGAAVCFTFRLGNSEKDIIDGIDESIYISNFKYSLNFDKEKIKLRNIRAFLLSPEPDEKIVFENGEESYDDFNLVINNLQVKNVPYRPEKIECKISFDYTIQDVTKSFSHTLIFKYGKTLGNYRLSLDIGTSAIVSTVSKGLSIRQLNLQNSLKKLINDDKIYKKDNIEEFGTNFLSSTSALIPEGKINSDNYSNNLIRISPTKEVAEQNPERVLPYLKSLVGQIYLPDKEATDNFEYYNHENEKVTIGEESIATKDILINTYKSVVKNFVVPQVKEIGVNEDLHKINLTVPNTYTLRHQSFIKKVFMDNFPDFPEEEIHFVSESDAVVAYYIANHDALNQDRNNEQLNKLKTGTEHVMVYDIGAGTLDITYFTINKQNVNGKEIQEVDVIGRFGALTAGNYLDYIIAKIIYEDYNQNFKVDIFEKSQSQTDFSIKIMYKNFIKEQIKPKLYIEESILAKENEFLSKEFEINLGKIVEHEYFKEYLNLCSSELFKNYFAMYSEDKSTYMPLDTVIMSGRTSNLLGLRNHVVSELKKFSKNEGLYSVKLGSKVLKSVVSDGAILKNYFDMPNSGVTFNIKDIYAQYGILFQNIINGTWNFVKLLDGKTYQAEKDKNPKKRRYSFKNTVDLSGALECHIVQTYYANTAKEMNSGKEEYINKIFSFSIDEFYGEDSKNAEIAISIDNNKEMIIELVKKYIDEPTAPLTIKSESNVYKNSLWPYYTI